jgi:hypothetical protein
MKNALWIACEFCAAAATGFLARNCKRMSPVELFAHRLERAWADRRTVVETN